MKIAKKLHAQFSHLEQGELIKLIKGAGKGENGEFIQNIRKVSDICMICFEYKRPSLRPVVGLLMATKFNELVAMDLKMLDRQWILHLIDHVERFLAAVFVSSKKQEEIIQKNFQSWISVFGQPAKFCLIMAGSSTMVGFGNFLNR